MEELDLKDLFNLFWRKKVQMILVILIFIGLGVIYTVGFTTPMYSSATTLVLTGAKTSGESDVETITTTDVTLNSKLVPTYSEIVRSRRLLTEVIENLGLDIEQDKLRNNVKVNAKEGTELIEITVTNENAEYSKKIANEIAKVFTNHVREYYKIENVKIVDVAEREDKPSNINHIRDISIFICVGIVVFGSYVLIATMLDTTIKTPEDIEKELKLPVLAAIPVYEIETQKKKKRGGRRK